MPSREERDTKDASRRGYSKLCTKWEHLEKAWSEATESGRRSFVAGFSISKQAALLELFDVEE